MILDFIKLNKDENSSLYEEIYKNIKNAVALKAIKNGEKLPSIRELAAQLEVSRTTVENAYARLCIEGIAESRPQKGYFIIGPVGMPENTVALKDKKDSSIKYDFSSRRVDRAAADTENWKKHIRLVLRNLDVLTSYGDPQGELLLREALASYSFKARGVIAKPDNIVIGAGVGPLLNILCGILGKNISVGIENGGFRQAQTIFEDYGILNSVIKSDSNGALPDELTLRHSNILFLMPSLLSKISVMGISRRRNEFSKWASEKDDRFIIEDDYNGELRYTARTLPAFQSKLPDKCIYIGSFSKLMLPSVRIAYMVLPDSLLGIFKEKLPYYNQTCGKTEQLALTEYISSGALEKHLRRLRRLYYNKSQILLNSLKKYPEIFKSSILYESSLMVEITTTLKLTSEEICKACEKNSIKILPSDKTGGIRLSFAGIESEKISSAIEALYKTLEKIK